MKAGDFIYIKEKYFRERGFSKSNFNNLLRVKFKIVNTDKIGSLLIEIPLKYVNYKNVELGWKSEDEKYYWWIDENYCSFSISIKCQHFLESE